MSRLLTSLLAALVLAPAFARADDAAALSRKDLDGRIVKIVYETIERGRAVFNAGDHAACYRIYDGALIALGPILDHHPALQKSIQAAQAKAAGLRTPADQAFALRAALDDIYGALNKDATPAATAKKSLYDRLGGEPAITAVVADFVGRAAGNPKVNFTRKGTKAEWAATPENVATLKKHLVQLVGMATGGPQKYDGKSMKEVHKGMAITEAEFNALAADLVATLKKFNVPDKEQQELLTIVGSTKADIVEGGAPAPETAKKSLYDRLGGEPAITAVVADFVDRTAKNPKVNFARKGTKNEWEASAENVAKLKKHLVQFVSKATGGPDKYEGKSMKEVHKGMEITEAEFNAMGKDLIDTLNKFMVPEKEQKDLLDIVASTKPDIVEKK
jgi:hemoglobin